MRRRMSSLRVALATLASAAALAAPPAFAQSASEEDLAKQLANPIASLISVPLQSNWDHDIGPARDGRKYYLNVQPVIPFHVNEDWNLVSRTIAPIVDQHISFLGDGSQSGIGDISQSFFFSPSKKTAGGVMWGAGPVILIPTDTDFISAKKWGLGPTAVVLKQQRAWTYGILANHIWSAGGSGPQDISTTFLQPFLAHTTRQAWTFSLNSESSFDWKHSQWTAPVNASVSKLTRIGKLPLSVGVGARYYADSPETGPHGWGARLVVTFLFPMK